MKKNNFLTLVFIALSIVFFSFKNASKPVIISPVSIMSVPDSSDISLKSNFYQMLHLKEAGLSKEAFDYAVKGYQKLVDDGTAQNQQYLTIVDMDQSSRKKRFYLLDMENHQLVLNTFVAHGKNSGADQAEQFSNLPNSEESSLGFYVTKTTYTGKHGVSLKLSGLENGFNNNAEARGIVVHGASYVNKYRVGSNFMGRSQGCPALPENEYSKVINLIKDGSVLFIYSSSQNYLNQSQILNS